MKTRLSIMLSCLILGLIFVGAASAGMLNSSGTVSSYFNHFTDITGWTLGQGLFYNRCDFAILQKDSVVYTTSGNRAAYVELPDPVVQSSTGILTVEVRYRYDGTGGMYIGLTKNDDFICEPWKNDGFIFATLGEGGDKFYFLLPGIDGLIFDIIAQTTHDGDWHIAKLIRNESGYWSIYIDEDLKGTGTHQDLDFDYRFLSVQAYSGANPGEIDYISVVHSLRVAVDIKPGSDPNSWPCKKENDGIPVAVLSTDTFDATSLEADSVRFGRTGTEAAEVHKKDGKAKRHVEDVNKDGLLDMVFHFRFGDTGFSCADIPTGEKSVTLTAFLTGATADGTPIEGADSLRLVKE